MAYVTPRTWTDGEVPTAAIMNQDVRDNIDIHSGIVSPDGAEVGARFRNLLHNSGFGIWHHTNADSLTSIADDVYGPDRWYGLTQTAAIQMQRSAGNRAFRDCLLKQSQAAAQRMGLAQIVEACESKCCRSSALSLKFACKPSVTTIMRYAILEWTGTADAVTSDVVLDWTSAVYTANAFFLAASLTVAAVGSISCAAGAWTDVTTLAATISASCNNLIVFVWTEGTAAQNVTVEISELILSREQEPEWYPPNMSEDVTNCQRFYEGGMGTDGTLITYHVYPAAAASIEMFSHLKFKTRKRAIPTITLYSAGGTINKISEVAGSIVDVVPTTGAMAIGDSGCSVQHNAAGSINGIGYHYAATADL
jgi:hypothetical protein